MSENQKQTIISAAKGHWQLSIARQLANGKTIVSPLSMLRGKAKNYSSHYAWSFQALLRRLEAAGIYVERKPGVRGGEYTATYRVVV